MGILEKVEQKLEQKVGKQAEVMKSRALQRVRRCRGDGNTRQTMWILENVGVSFIKVNAVLMTTTKLN